MLTSLFYIIREINGSTANIKFYPLIPKLLGENHPLGADDFSVGDERVEVHARNEVFASDGHVGLASGSVFCCFYLV